ncbi:MAG: STAS domain-containing protein [Sedimenticola sp.]
MSQPITLGPLLTIAEVAETRSYLEGLLRTHQEIVISGASVSTTDSAGIQLLTAFFLEAESRGISILWQSTGDAIPRAAKFLGLSDELALPGAEPGE